MDVGFDIFLSHNGRDRQVVLEIAKQLKARGFSVWVDVEQLVPGRSFQEDIERVIASVASAAICVGRHGLGPWEEREMRACLHEFVERELPVIPVMLPGGPAPGALPAFLRDFTCVDLRGGIDPEGVDRLVRGIIGSMAIGMTRGLTAELVERETREEDEPEFVDAWGIASVKSRLYAIAELIAQTAADEAAVGATSYPADVLTLLVPLVVELRWRRGYAAALERMLKIPPLEGYVGDLAPEEVPGGCPVSEGVVSAREEEDGRVTLLLEQHPAAQLRGLDPAQRAAVLHSVNSHGRLGVPATGGMTLLERIGEIPIRSVDAVTDELAAALHQNRAVLAPLMARWGMPGSAWLLREDEEFFAPAPPLAGGRGVSPSAVEAVRARLAAAAADSDTEVVDATGAVEDPTRMAERMQAQWQTFLGSL